jgi:BON domain-containing protein
MKYRLAGITCIATVALFLAGCGGDTNRNANINTNVAPANANTPVNNANANTNTRKGLTREEYERDKEKYQREAKSAGRKIGTGLNDGWIWVKTRFELAAADDLRDSTINVDVENGVVTLTGTVASAEQKAKAEAVAKSIEGVTAVKNLLKVAPSGPTNLATNSTNKAANRNSPKKY